MNSNSKSTQEDDLEIDKDSGHIPYYKRIRSMIKDRTKKYREQK